MTEASSPDSSQLGGGYAESHHDPGPTVEAVLAAATAGEACSHLVVLAGPPGVGKSAVGVRLLDLLRAAQPHVARATDQLVEGGLALDRERLIDASESQARALAERILAQPVLSDHQANLESRVTTAYRQILQRNPSGEEVTRALSHVHEQETDLSGADSTQRAWASFCQALLASSEFRYID